MARICTECNCPTEFTSTNDGSIVCTICGTIAESSNIVSEIQFTEGSSVVGTFVSSRPSRYRSLGRDSRELSMENAKRRIEEISAPLHIRPHHIESALRSFELALENGFTKGRRTRLVGAACLYSVCRREQTPHLLIDFSEILQVNVFVLANTFLQLIKTLNIRLPIIDPSIFIQRFAQSLEFAEKTSAVVTTANKLVQRMKRDWMSTGRKPSGICGAALYMASKIHGFKRSLKEIIHVVKIGEVTLLKRLNEFQKTPAGSLKIHEFDTMDVEQERDPPSYIDNKKREEKKRLKEIEKRKEIDSIEEILMDVDSDGNTKRKRKYIKTRRTKKLEEEENEKENGNEIEDKEIDDEIDENENKKDEDEDEKEKETDNKIEDGKENGKIFYNNEEDYGLGELLQEAQDSLNSNKDVIDQFTITTNLEKEKENEENIEKEKGQIVKVEKGLIKSSNNNNNNNKKHRESENQILIQTEKKEYIPSILDTDEGLKEYLSESLPSLEETDIEEYPLLPEQENKEVDESVFEPTDDLEGLDDDVEDYIETDKVLIDKKEKVWVHTHQDWVIKEEEKKKEIEEDIAAGRPPRRRKTATPSAKKAADNAAIAANEALRRHLRNTKLIEKFGLVLPTLFDGSKTNQESQPTTSSRSQPQPQPEPQPEETSGSLFAQKIREYEDDDYYEHNY